MADEEIKAEEKPETPPESSTEETGAEDKKETGEETDKTSEEPRVPLSRLRKLNDKIKDLEKELRSRGGKEPSMPSSGSEEEKAENYLEALTERVIEKREKARADIKKKEDEAFETMLDSFAETDKDFDRKKFVELVEKYKPADEDAAWNLWKDFKKGVKSSDNNLQVKPKMPIGKKTTDEVPPKDYSSDKDKPLWQILEEAKKEHGIKK